MAADYEIDAYQADALQTRASAIVVDGVEVGSSFSNVGEDFAEDQMWGLPQAYFKQFASAMPLPRIGYDPVRDLAPPRYSCGGIDGICVCFDPSCSLRMRNNRVTQATLQRERRVKGTGHGSGSGRTRKRVLAIETDSNATPEALHMEELPDTRFLMSGFTRGICEYYADRQAEIRTELEQLAVYLKEHREIPEHLRCGFPLPPKEQRRNLEARGVKDEHIEFIRVRPGLGRVALIHNAVAKDANRIGMRDGSVDRPSLWWVPPVAA